VVFYGAGSRALRPDVIELLDRQVVEVAKRDGVMRRRRFRVDPTVVETNVHYPTDCALLQDRVRLLTRTLQPATTALGDARGRIGNRRIRSGNAVLRSISVGLFSRRESR